MKILKIISGNKIITGLNKWKRERTAFPFLLFLILLIAAGNIYAQDSVRSTQAALKYGWPCPNYGDTVYSWDIFSHAFFGIPPSESSGWISDVFDKAYYELAVKEALPNKGNGTCYGLSLMSLMMNKYGGYYGYCAPPMQYVDVLPNGWPSDPNLHRTINIMMTHQLGLPCVQSFIEQVAYGKSQDGNNAVNRFKEIKDKEGPCLISVTKGLNPSDGGHTLIAYDLTDDGSGNYQIWVVDPNHLWFVNDSTNRGFYSRAENHIDVPASGAWTYMMAGRFSAWPCDNDKIGSSPRTTGHLTVYAVTLVGPTAPTPASMGVSVLGILAQVIILNERDTSVQNHEIKDNKNPFKAN